MRSSWYTKQRVRRRWRVKLLKAIAEIRRAFSNSGYPSPLVLVKALADMRAKLLCVLVELYSIVTTLVFVSLSFIMDTDCAYMIMLQFFYLALRCQGPLLTLTLSLVEQFYLEDEAICCSLRRCSCRFCKALLSMLLDNRINRLPLIEDDFLRIYCNSHTLQEAV
jgi:hypothetical protein